MRWVLVMALLASATSVRADQSKVMDGTDFVTGFREVAGQKVTVTDCRVGGTTSTFIRCETPNGAASYALDAATMDRADLKMVYANCPTGSRRKPSCAFTVTGSVKSGGMPAIEGAKLAPVPIH